MLTAVSLASGLTVTVTAGDWLGANVPSPEYWATTESVPPGNKFVEMVTVPLALKANEVLLLKVPIANGWPPVGVAISETSPVGTTAPEPCVTWTVKFALEPWAIVAEGDAVIAVVSEAREAELQFVSKFPTFTEPRPVALSNPGTAPKAGVVVLAGSTSTPYWFAAALVLLQFGLPPAQATELFPVITS